MMGVSSNLHGLCIIIIPCCVLFSCYIQAEAQTGFVSIDCGGTGRYRDENSITWTPDTDSQAISSEGNATAVEPPLYAKTYPTPLSTIRYFPGNHSKYCYVFGSDDGVKKDSAYLIRASFWAGSALPYGTRVVNQVRFDLLIYANLWDEIAISFPQVEREDFREMQIIAVRDSIDVCLVGSSSGLDIPFISSLVLRPLDPEMISVGHMMNVIGKRPLMTVERFNYGAPSSQTYVRYQGNQMGDRFDRIWFPNTMQPILSTTSLVDTNTIEGIPIIVLQTALEEPELIDIPLDLGYGGYYFLYLYFAEISQEVSGAGERVFDIRVFNGSNLDAWWNQMDVYKDSGNTANSLEFFYLLTPIYTGVGSQSRIEVKLIKSQNSTYGPLICALDLLKVYGENISLGTDDDEVTSLKRIISNFPSLEGWSGDPCLPFAYNWLTCTNDSRPYISTISLELHDLGGKIPNDFNNLKFLTRLSLAENKLNGSIPILDALQNLEYLDLHGNQLSGEIPEFLGQLPALTTLNLDDNNLTGEIPEKLIQKASASMLNLSVSGNSVLCGIQSNQKFCMKKPPTTKINVALIAGIVGSVTVLCAIGIIICSLRHFLNGKRKPSPINVPSQQDTTSDHESVLPQGHTKYGEKELQIFSFQEIKSISKNFRQEIGQGGFGIVYLGTLNGVHVAVKVLSADSYQEKTQFQNEVKLLSRVHHNNLVKLLGYCSEERFVLVYEYMEKGSLSDCINGRGETLSLWRDRLKIAVDVAEGLEYLHKHCEPRIIHRDVKSNNILIDGNFVGKLCDFGISKSVQLDPSAGLEKLQTTVLIGSDGYIDPECVLIFPYHLNITSLIIEVDYGCDHATIFCLFNYLFGKMHSYMKTRIATHSIDVYAFGVVLFEIMTGRPPMIREVGIQRETVRLTDWAKYHINRGEVSVILDPSLSADMKEQSMMMVIEVAMSCVDSQVEKRPTMDKIKGELKKALDLECRAYSIDAYASEEMMISTRSTPLNGR